MTVELLQTLSLAAYIAAGIMLLVSVALFFLLDVPKLYGDISGRTAKKAIEAIRQQNETSGNKAYKPSPVNAARGKLTDKITPSGRLESQTAGLPVSVGTEKFATSALAPQANETTLLTGPLSPEGQDFEQGEQSANETTLLTGALSEAGMSRGQGQRPSNESGFTLEAELSFTGSTEIIE